MKRKFEADEELLDVEKFMTELPYASVKKQSERVKSSLSKKRIPTFTPLHDAAFLGEINTVQMLLNIGSNTQDRDGDTPLHKAAEKGHFSVVECLVKHGADFRIRNKKGLEPIHVAAGNGYKDIVEYLVNSNVNVDERDADHCTPLHHAASKGHLNIIEYLVDKGACVNAMSTTGTKIIQVADTKDYEDIVKFLKVKTGNYHEVYKQLRDLNHETCVLYDTEKCHAITLKVLVKKGVPRSEWYVSRLLEMELYFTETGMKLLDEYIAYSDNLLILDPNFDCGAGNTPLHEAAKEGYLDIVECLVKNGAHTNLNNSIGLQPIHIAARNGKKNIVEFLLANNVEVDKRDEFGWTALHHATDNCQLSMMEYLVNKGADVKAKTDMHVLPLHIAAMCRPLINEPISRDQWHAGENWNSSGNNTFRTASFSMDQGHQYSSDRDKEEKYREASSMVLDFLISKDGGINDSERNGFLPLHYALLGKTYHIVEKLIEAGARVDMQVRVEKTPLHIAVENGFLDIFKKMIEREPNLDVQDKYGDTPLHLACKNGEFKIMKCLLEAGAKSNIQNFAKHTVLYYYIFHCMYNPESTSDDSVPPEEILGKISEYICVDGKSRSSALHIFIESREENIVFLKQLLQWQKDINVKDMHDTTPMTYAVSDWLCSREEWSEQLIKVLVDHGAYFTGTEAAYLAEAKKVLFRDIEMCSKSISNKFNNYYLPLLYRHPIRLPPIENFKLTRDQMRAIEHIVKAAIRENGYCDVTKIQYPSLAMLAVKSYVSHMEEVTSIKD